MNQNMENWKSIIANKLMEPNVTFGELYRILVEMKKNNLERDIVYESLIEIKNLDAVQAMEPKEDLVLELMDIVTGFCSPHLQLWE